MWPFKRRNPFAEIEAQGNAAALARHRVKQDRARIADKADELRRDLAAGKHAVIPDRSEVVATVLWGRALKREREAIRG